LPLAAAFLAAAGCGKPTDIDDVYGRRRGVEGGTSVNGTGVLAKMFESAGYRVTTWNRLSPGLEGYDVIVWAPDDFCPPTQEQRDFLRRWLTQEDNRTLVYIGRDYDAAITYWQKMKPGAPPGQAAEIARRLATAQANHNTARGAMPAEEYCDWFTVRRDGPLRDVRTLRGPFSQGIDASKVEIQIQGRLDQPQQSDLELVEDDQPEEEFTDFGGWYEPYVERRQLPEVMRVLLESEGDVLVSCVSDFYFSESKIIVVTNGSFLLNVPLVNHEHRKLAGKLVAECGSPGKAAFLESGPGGPTVYDKEPGTKYPTGLEALTVWPIGCILMHLAVVGILVCFCWFPIFGKPRELATGEVSDFGKHIDALGELLEKTGDHGFATSRLAQYEQTVKGDSGTTSRPALSAVRKARSKKG